MTTASTAERLRVGGDELRFLLTSAQSGGESIAFVVEMPAGGGPPALHRHPSMEIYRMEKGELCLYLGDDDGGVRRTAIAAGEMAFIPAGAEHTIRNESADPARAFVILAPGTELEGFARAAAELSDRAGPGEVIELAAAHGIEITRPLEAACA